MNFQRLSGVTAEVHRQTKDKGVEETGELPLWNGLLCDLAAGPASCTALAPVAQVSTALRTSGLLCCNNKALSTVYCPLAAHTLASGPLGHCRRPSVLLRELQILYLVLGPLGQLPQLTRVQPRLCVWASIL